MDNADPTQTVTVLTEEEKQAAEEQRAAEELAKRKADLLARRARRHEVLDLWALLESDAQRMIYRADDGTWTYKTLQPGCVRASRRCPFTHERHRPARTAREPPCRRRGNCATL